MPSVDPLTYLVRPTTPSTMMVQQSLGLVCTTALLYDIDVRITQLVCNTTISTIMAGERITQSIGQQKRSYISRQLKVVSMRLVIYMII